MKNPVFEALAGAARRGEAVTLGIITGVKGSSPQKQGATAVFQADGRIWGTLGGGCLEAEVQRRALDALRTGQPESFELVLDHDFGWDDGLICGGMVRGLILPNAQAAGEQLWTDLAERSRSLTWGVRRDYTIAALAPGKRLAAGARPMTAAPPAPVPQTDPDWLYSETVSPPCALWIAGAGHVARAVAPLALKLDFDVTVFDDRPALVSHRHFPPETRLQAEVWEKLLAVPLPSVPCFGLIVTRGHRHDALVLERWIHQPFGFLGMIGSARKARMIFEHFLREKLATAEELQRVASPVGVKIQCRSVMEIAVSIMGQFIDQRAKAAEARRTQTEVSLAFPHKDRL